MRTSERLREGLYVAGDGRSVLAQAEREDWEGLIVKDADAPYLSGVRSRTWRKIKLHKRVTLVIGGWTDPKGTRSGFGALMVGRFTDARGKPARPAKGSDATLCYAGNVGGGFSEAAISDLLAAAAAARADHVAVRRCPARARTALGGAAPALRGALQRVDPRGAIASSRLPRAA